MGGGGPNQLRSDFARDEGGGAVPPWAPQNGLQASVFADEQLKWPGSTSKC